MDLERAKIKRVQGRRIIGNHRIAKGRGLPLLNPMECEFLPNCAWKARYTTFPQNMFFFKTLSRVDNTY
jgi:hypothetical protein